jgi:hypothetical protein
MIPLPLVLSFVRRYWKYAAGALVMALIWLAWHRHGVTQYNAGIAAEKSLWAKDRANRMAVDNQIIADQKAKDAATQARNEEIDRGKDEKLAALAADRDNLGRMLFDARDRLRTLAASQATGERGLAVASGIASRAAEAESALREQWNRYDYACRRDAVRFQALQDQIGPQL